MKRYVVWNTAKTMGLFTTDKELALRVSSNAFTVCYGKDGKVIDIATSFSAEWCKVKGQCTMEKVDRKFPWPVGVEHFTLEFDQGEPIWLTLKIHGDI